MKEYKLTEVHRRGEWESSYGPMVTFAIAVDGVEGYIKLNQKPDTPEPEVGEVITGVIQDKTDKKGQPYKQFKKMNPNYDNQSGKSSLDNSKIDYIVQMLEELTGRRSVPELPAEPLPIIDADPFAGLDI